MSDLRLSRLAFATAALALLAACGEEAPSDDSRAATGEVLEGTISDEMLPLDRVQSEAPLADPTGTARGSQSNAGADDAEPADEAEIGAEDAPAAESVETDE